MARKHYIITLGDPLPTSMAEIIRQLVAAGFELTQQLDAIGVILGRADETVVERLRKLHGIAAVEEDRTVRPWSANES
jgi:hypothetical protein